MDPAQQLGGAVEALITISGSMTRRGVDRPVRIISCIMCRLVRPTPWKSSRMVVSGGEKKAAAGMSSTPTRE